MRGYLPIAHSDLTTFLFSQSFVAERVFAPTQTFIQANLDCDEEEIEFLLSHLAGIQGLEIRTRQSAPGIVLALELESGQCGESYENTIALTSSLAWSQVQCALLSHTDDDELIWYATQEISLELDTWK